MGTRKDNDDDVQKKQFVTTSNVKFGYMQVFVSKFQQLGRRNEMKIIITLNKNDTCVKASILWLSLWMSLWLEAL